MTIRLTDPRLLMQLAEPEIWVRVGSVRTVATISDYEDVTYATLCTTLYTFGPPPRPYHIHARWPWLEVHEAWTRRRPLNWY